MHGHSRGACRALEHVWQWRHVAVRAPVRRLLCLRACGAGWVHAREPRPDAARERRTGAARCSLGARNVHVHVCSVVLVRVIMRHCSVLENNRITELPDQTFDKNVELTILCVDSHHPP